MKMKKLIVTVNDYEGSSKSLISFHDNDFQLVKDNWTRDDPYLEKMQTVQSLSGYTKWCELSPEHYRILITYMLNVLSKLSDEARIDPSEPAVNSLNFLIMAFVLCLEDRTASTIDHFRINRIDRLNVVFDYSASFEVDYDLPQGKNSEPSFKVIVIE